MKGLPNRKIRREEEKKVLTKNFGNQDKDFYKKVNKKRKLKRLRRKEANKILINSK